MRPDATEVERLRKAIAAAFASPWVADVEDYVWEALFHYVKRIDLPDAIVDGRTKQLFDAVAPNGIGWSLKTLLKPVLTVGSSIEFVIQRADVTTKAANLGFPKGLSRESPPRDLGAAVVRHWNEKFDKDLVAQRVTDPRLAILVKDASRTNFTYLEQPYLRLREDEILWGWSNAARKGLLGRIDGELRLRWYFNQKQLFQVDRVPMDAQRFAVDWKRMDPASFIDRVLGNTGTAVVTAVSQE